MKVVASYNIKGGVGKTSTAVNLAALAARDGQRTLLWDLDPQGAASFLFRIRPRVKGGGKALLRGRTSVDDAIKGTDFDNLDLLPSDFSYRNMDLDLDAAAKKPVRQLRGLIAPLADEYDTVFLDCPPGISLVSENIMAAADALLVPLMPATLSLRTFDQLTAFVAGLDGRRPTVLAFFSMVDRRKRQHRDVVDGRGGEDQIAAATIPALTAIEQMAQSRAPIVMTAPRSRASRCYEQLWAELQQAL